MPFEPRTGRISGLPVSPRSMVGVVAVTDLSLRVVAPVAAVLLDLAVSASPEVVGSAFSLVTGGMAGLGWIPPVFEWLVTGTLVYLGVSGLLPTEPDSSRYRHEFRLLAASLALVLAVTLRNAGSAESVLIVWIAAVLAGTGLLLAYLRFRVGWPLLDPDGRLVRTADSLSPGRSFRNEIARDLSREGWMGHLGAILALSAVGVPLSITVFAAGVGAALLSMAFPLPDLLLLGWVVADGSDGWQRRSYAFLDVESRVYRVLDLANRNLKGMMLAIAVLLGALVATLFISVAVSQALSYGRAVVGIATTDPITAWNVVGFLLVIIGSGLFQLHVWLGQVRRLHAFLDHDIVGPVRAVSARPPGHVAVPVVALLAASWIVQDGPASGGLSFAAFWLLALVGFVALVRVTEGFASQPTDSERRVAVLGLWTQFIGAWSLGTFGSTAGDVTLGVLLMGLVSPTFAFVLVLLLLLPYLPDVIETGRREDSRKRFAGPVSILLVGVVSSLVARGSQTYELLGTTLAVICLAGGGLLLVTRYYRL